MIRRNFLLTGLAACLALVNPFKQRPVVGSRHHAPGWRWYEKTVLGSYYYPGWCGTCSAGSRTEVRPVPPRDTGRMVYFAWSEDCEPYGEYANDGSNKLRKLVREHPVHSIEFIPGRTMPEAR